MKTTNFIYLLLALCLSTISCGVSYDFLAVDYGDGGAYVAPLKKKVKSIEINVRDEANKRGFQTLKYDRISTNFNSRTGLVDSLLADSDLFEIISPFIDLQRKGSSVHAVFPPCSPALMSDSANIQRGIGWSIYPAVEVFRLRTKYRREDKNYPLQGTYDKVSPTISGAFNLLFRYDFAGDTVVLTYALVGKDSELLRN